MSTPSLSAGARFRAALAEERPLQIVGAGRAALLPALRALGRLLRDR